jgi:hypothetical protein
MELLALEDFADAVGETFAVDAGDDRFELKLEKAEELPAPAAPSGSFRLEFRGPFEPILPQAIYTFRRESDAHEIFVVPIGRNEAGTQYEAVFTRLPSA